MPNSAEIPSAAITKLGPSHALFLRLAHCIPSLVELCNAAGDMVYLNPAGRELIGVHLADIYPQRMTDYVVPAQRSMVFSEIIPTARDHGVWHGQMQLLNAGTGAVIDVQRTTFRVLDAAGTVTGYVSVMDQVAAESTGFLSTMATPVEDIDPVAQFSHDFINVVASVLSGFSMIERRSTEPMIKAIAIAGKKAGEEGLVLAKRLKDICQ